MKYLLILYFLFSVSLFSEPASDIENLKILIQANQKNTDTTINDLKTLIQANQKNTDTTINNLKTLIQANHKSINTRVDDLRGSIDRLTYIFIAIMSGLFIYVFMERRKKYLIEDLEEALSKAGYKQKAELYLILKKGFEEEKKKENFSKKEVSTNL